MPPQCLPEVAFFGLIRVRCDRLLWFLSILCSSMRLICSIDRIVRGVDEKGTTNEILLNVEVQIDRDGI